MRYQYSLLRYKFINNKIKNSQSGVWPALHLFKKILGIVAALLLLNCASKTQLSVADDQWKYQEAAISIQVDAPADLNARSGRPHALTLGIYQLSDPNTFGALTVEKSGAIELLSQGRLDETIVDFRRITVQPGQNLVEVLSRAENAKHVGVIAGYFELSVKQDIQLFKIPCTASKRGIVEKTLASLSLIANEADAFPTNLALSINLGSSSVKKFQESNVVDLKSVCN